MREILAIIVLVFLCVVVVKACEDVDKSDSIGAAIGKNVKDFREAINTPEVGELPCCNSPNIETGRACMPCGATP